MSDANLGAKMILDYPQSYPDKCRQLARAFAVLAKEEILATQRADDLTDECQRLREQLADKDLQS